MNAITPTQQTYGDLQLAYDHFNKQLFENKLPNVLITLQRKARALGYAAYKRFGTRTDDSIVDELALNPSHFKGNTNEQILSTLVHEMAHIWQFHLGNPGRTRYHNREWARKMLSIGLFPSSTGEPGGKQTGDSVSHYIISGGPFEQSCEIFLQENLGITFIERWRNPRWNFITSNKTKFTCGRCRSNAWGKPDLNIICGECNQTMNAPNA